MFTNFTRFITNVLVFMILVYTMNSISIVQATSSRVQQVAGSGPQVIPASAFDKSRPLSSITPIPATSALFELRNHPMVPKALNGTSNDVTDVSIVQTSLLSKSVSNAMAAPATSFDGIGATGYSPPDTNGDVGYSSVTGKKYYMQTVNKSFQIWDVTNPVAITSLYGPALGNTLWSGFGGICETNNDGDPIVLFDHLANRWMFSQFAFNLPNNFHQCIAISTSADPTSTWYRYDFQYSTTKLNDYPKFGVWPDGYYMSVNQFDGSTDAWRGAGAVVFNRTAMLSGLPATMIKFDLGEVVIWYGLMLPSDLDGAAPPAGTPNYFIEWDDSDWHNDPADTLRIWNFHVDWANPANSTFGANAFFDPNAMVATANLDSNMCNGSRDCIPQPGTAQKLDAIASAQLMYRLQYRNFGSYQTLVGNQTVDATGADKAGIYWFELRNNGIGWGINQQGVYAPDTDNRWMGSTAMDSSGNIALGYSVSSSSTYPSVRYTGRLVSDPPGTLPQGEASLVAGGGSQTGNNRWGDYSMMTVDPTDGCTFWYTQEYYSFTSSSSWKTRIGSFAFPSCTHTISGNAGVGGVTLSYTDGTAKTVTSSGNGNYAFPVSNNWSGTVTPSHTCFTFNPTSKSYSNIITHRTGQNYTPTLKPAAGCADVDVLIGGSNVGNYGVAPEKSIFDRYRINGGPVKVSSTNALPIFTSQRAIYGASFNSIVGYPADQLTTDYWFTSYDDLGMITYLVIGNPHPSNTALVDVYIGGVKKNASPYSIAPGQRIFPRYTINAGPVHVVSTNGVDIFTSERTKFGNSFNEVMGYPGNQLTTDYWFTSYDDVGMITHLVIGNPHATLTAEVDVYIGGIKRNTTPYSIAPGQRIFPRYTINGGPVQVVSTNGVDIFTSERSRFGNTFNEVMGYPANQLTTDYWFTSYDDVGMITYLVIGNPHATLTAEVDVYINGVKKNTTPYSIAPGQRVFPRYTINGGPVHVVSTNGVDIFTSERAKYLSSFNEILGLANNQLTTDYWFTAYDDVGMTTYLIIAAP